MNKLTPHFTMEELTRSDTAARQGLDNTPTPEAAANLRRLASTLEEVRAITGTALGVTSGYRSDAVNIAVGGVGKSAHRTGLAADINRPGSSAYELGLSIIKAGIKFDQLIHEYGRWVHIAIAPEGQTPRGQVLSIKTGQGYVSGWIK